MSQERKEEQGGVMKICSIYCHPRDLTAMHVTVRFQISAVAQFNELASRCGRVDGDSLELFNMRSE
jgi:hypothetical protein